MNATTVAAPIAPAADDRYRLTVEQYERIGEAGIIRDKEPIHLWRGLLVKKWPKTPRRSAVMGMTHDCITKLLPEGYHARHQQSIRLSDWTMPEPDDAIVRGAIRDYGTRHPSASEACWVIVVAEEGLAFDRGEALEEYALAGIAIYWIVNIRDREVEVHTDPTGPAEAPTYRTKHTYSADESVPIVLDGREVGAIRVAEILP